MSASIVLAIIVTSLATFSSRFLGAINKFALDSTLKQVQQYVNYHLHAFPNTEFTGGTTMGAMRC